jgi:hypothetical protein
VPESTPVVPISDVINSLKCGLGKALEKDTTESSGLRNAIALVKLDVNVVEGRSANARLDTTGVAGIPVSTGTSVSPRFGFGRAQSLTNNTTIDFQISISGSNDLACKLTENVFVDAGFSVWIADVVEQLANVASGPPLASIIKYTYDSNFIIDQTVDGGIKFRIIPVEINADAAANRSDVQHIRIEIGAVRMVNGKVEAGGPERLTISD